MGQDRTTALRSPVIGRLPTLRPAPPPSCPPPCPPSSRCCSDGGTEVIYLVEAGFGGLPSWIADQIHLRTVAAVAIKMREAICNHAARTQFPPHPRPLCPSAGVASAWNTTKLRNDLRGEKNELSTYVHAEKKERKKKKKLEPPHSPPIHTLCASAAISYNRRASVDHLTYTSTSTPDPCFVNLTTTALGRTSPQSLATPAAPTLRSSRCAPRR